MNYNYQNNNGYSYNGYTYPNYQQQQSYNQNLQNYNNYQPQYLNQAQAQQPIQRAKCDYIAVSSLEEVKAYIMNASSTVLFKDSNNKVIYEKKTDSQGISEIKEYKEFTNNEPQYVTLEDFNMFKNDFDKRLNELSSKGE